MKEHPILFTGPMVKAILEGRKTQTRRVVKFKPPFESHNSWKYAGIISDGNWMFTNNVPPEQWENAYGKDYLKGPGKKCPYGKPGDRLWVREHWGYRGATNTRKDGRETNFKHVHYHADDSRRSVEFPNFKAMMDAGPHQNIKYPKGYDKEDYHEQEYIKGGLLSEWWRKKRSIPSIHMPRWASRVDLEITDIRVERVQEITAEDSLAEGVKWDGMYEHPKDNFMKLWDSINGNKHPWSDNPWVWVVEFRRA